MTIHPAALESSLRKEDSMSKVKELKMLVDARKATAILAREARAAGYHNETIRSIIHCRLFQADVGDTIRQFHRQHRRELSA
jgi:hypothetical protein